jgi:hypothetical protein
MSNCIKISDNFDAKNFDAKIFDVKIARNFDTIYKFYIYKTTELSVRTSVVSWLISRPPGVLGGNPRAQKNRNEKKVPLAIF